MLVTEKVPLIGLPGPVQTSGSVSLTVGVGVNWLTVTVTVKEHVAVRLEPSVAVQFTVVVPTGKLEPEAGEQLVVTPAQLSLAVGAG